MGGEETLIKLVMRSLPKQLPYALEIPTEICLIIVDILTSPHNSIPWHLTLYEALNLI